MKRFILTYDLCIGFDPDTHSFTSERKLETFNEFFDTEDEANLRYNELKSKKDYSSKCRYTFYSNFKLTDRK